MTIPYPPLDTPQGWVCPTCGASWAPTFLGPCTHQDLPVKTDNPQPEPQKLIQETHTCYPTPSHRPGTTTAAGWSCHQCNKWHPDFIA